MTEIKYTNYRDESQLGRIKYLMDLDLSEPYRYFQNRNFFFFNFSYFLRSVYTYRYFTNNFQKHTILAVDSSKDNLISKKRKKKF